MSLKNQFLLAEGSLVHAQHLIPGAGAGIATGAHIGHGGIRQGFQVFLLHADFGQRLGNVHIDGKIFPTFLFIVS